ncbi:peptidoglycan D,D-transpeptidase FtsI family protein [Kiloniella sp. b19]|uniref:peptidoglycan D,D-transpeptidase FtsI family protein n=1 Tax=Kiloniella sp. GXU_MW_B19 TaxID=3141326 RepID=UPI0031DDBCDD
MTRFSLRPKPGRITKISGGKDFEPVISLDSQTRVALETGRNRMLVMGGLMIVVFLAIAAKLVDLTVFQSSAYQTAKSSFESEVPETLPRADIVDRNGIVLATSLPTASLYAEPRKIPNPSEAARMVSEVLPSLSRSKLLERFSEDRGFVWIKRNLTPRQQYTINALGIPGLNFKTEERRFYPLGESAAHIIGFAGVDNRGLAGMEQAFNTTLSESKDPLSLSLDMRIQHILTEEIQTAMDRFSAIGATGIVMDIETGEVLASSSLPSFDLNDPGNASEDARFNRATLGIYEMGSTFKVLTAAMALDEGVVSPVDGYDVSKPIRVARFTINDYKPKKQWLSVPEILIYSSNIGTVQMAMELGTTTQRKYLTNFGLLQPAATELREVGTPLVPSPWREINTMTISYGHGLAVSPLQLSTAISSVVNGGIIKPATFLKRTAVEPVPGRRVISEATSKRMRDMMRLVVLHGSGRNADAKGYLVGGKTGTADKLKGGRYAKNSRVSSFVGAFPMSSPRYVVYVMVDEPKGIKETYGFATGGWVAAPVVKNVVERMAPLLGIAPEFETEVADEGSETLLKKAKARMEGRPIAYQ